MSNAILVVGAGFTGLTSAIEAAELGHDVYVVEKLPWLGGRVAQLNKYFPKLCPPSCGLEIQFQRIRNTPNIKFFTMAEVTGISGRKGAYKAQVRLSPRHTAAQNVDFSLLASTLDGTAPNEFDFGLSERKALYKAAPFAYPARWALDPGALTRQDAARVAGNRFLDMGEKAREIELEAGSIIIATGWKPYPLEKLINLGGGKIKNCISNMQMERLASPSGPTAGKIRRVSDGKPPKTAAFVQCAGSRDQNHLNYCSFICCLATFKQCFYLIEQNPDIRITIYYIDLRAPGRYINVLEKAQSMPNIRFVKGKVAEIQEGKNGNVILTAEDVITGQKSSTEYDMAVLATGMQPSLADSDFPIPVPLDSQGFVAGGEKAGIYSAGCALMPLDVSRSAQGGTAAALKAVQTVRGR